MALATGWTIREVYGHSVRELQAMSKVLTDRARTQRMAQAHKR